MIDKTLKRNIQILFKFAYCCAKRASVDPWVFASPQGSSLAIKNATINGKCIYTWERNPGSWFGQNLKIRRSHKCAVDEKGDRIIVTRSNKVTTLNVESSFGHINGRRNCRGACTSPCRLQRMRGIGLTIRLGSKIDDIKRQSTSSSSQGVLL